MYDLHIHSCLSDGILDIQETINNSFYGLNVASFCDHEFVFDPTKYAKRKNCIKLISGVELCCNINGVAIEILGYNFDTNNKEFKGLVKRLRNLRNNLLKSILEDEKIDVYDLPYNIFRKDIKKYFIKKYGDYDNSWKKYNKEYKKICHSVAAEIVIENIRAAGGIPVLAHPMESFKGLDEKVIEKLILDLDINVVEMVTPKHTLYEIEFIRKILNKYGFGASVGSDTHGQYRGNMNRYNIDLQDHKFDWIRQL